MFSLVARRWARRPATMVDIAGVGNFDLVLHDCPDIWISDPIRRGEMVDPHILELLRELITPGSVFVDVGANIGWFTVIGSRLTGRNGRVFAIEPDPRNYEILTRNVTLNGCCNVRIDQVAAGASDATAWLYRSIDNQGDHRLSVVSERADRIQVRVCRLDSVLRRRTHRVDLVKIDTQGSETAVLNGMTDLLRANPRVRLILEFWPHGLEDCGSSTTELTKALSQRPSLFWLLRHDESATAVSPEDIERLGREEFAPATLHHADLVSIAEDDEEARTVLRAKEQSTSESILG
jgi:FkbM family methyltransferase